MPMWFRPRACWGFTLLAAALAAGFWGVGAFSEETEDSLDRDYAAELPRIAPKSPDEALDTFIVAEGFKIEQVAAEPLVADPVAISFDEDGRLYVIEMCDYSEQDKERLGRVRRLVDTDGDGRFDHSDLFAEGLSWPTAITCYDGGVFVGAPPEIYYLKDTNGDGKADVQKVVFTGLGRSNVQGMLNTFLWGLDNRIHAATSSSGAELRRADQPDAAPLVLRGRDFAWEPRSLEVAATSGGGQHGMSFDPWGDKFVCSNSNHLQAVLFEDRYVARNPYFAAPSPRVNAAADGPQADVYRASPVEPWRIVRTRLRAKGVVPGVVEGGGRPAGYFTGATGYPGDAWPEQYYGWVVVADVGSNLIHRKRIDRNGLEVMGRRVDEKSEFVASTDIWFRPVQFGGGPDGALYVCDMYREVIEHPASLPPIIKKHLDLTSGRDRGRIYRIVPANFKQAKPPRLSEATTAELCQLLEHPNGWQRTTAARLIYERQDRRVTASLVRLASSSQRPEGRIHALYALAGLGTLTSDVLRERLDDEHPQVRRHAIRLSEPFLADSAALREPILALASGAESDEVAVYQLAFTLGELTGPRKSRALAGIARRYPQHPWMRVAVFSSLAEDAGGVLAELAADASFRKTAAGKKWLGELAAQIGKQQRPDDVAPLLHTLRGLAAADAAEPGAKETLTTIVQSLGAAPTSPLGRQVAAATGGQSEQLLKAMLADAAQAAANESLAVEKRVEAVHLLSLGGWAAVGPAADALLRPDQPDPIQAALVRSMQSFPESDVADLLLDRWPGLTPRLRTDAAETLFSRPAWLPRALAAVEDGQVAASDLQPGRLQSLAGHADEKIAAQAKRILEQAHSGGRQEVIEQYRSALATQGDPEKGRAVFRKVCSTCHQVEGFGHEIAPNLAAMQARGPEAILVNVLDPNREVNPLYLTYAVITKDGRSLTGMLAGDTATSVTLKRAENASDTVLRIDIEEMRSMGVSLMPEGLEKQVDVQGMADLLAYLQSVK